MIYTIGHSTRNWEDFVRVLKAYGIKIIVDVRHFPSSKKFPWFCKEHMEKALENEGIKYIWLKELGGYRKEGYANYMKSKEFEKGIEKLIKIAEKEKTAILCAELIWWRCHRRYIADVLVKKGIEVVHIWDESKSEKHKWQKLIKGLVLPSKIKDKIGNIKINRFFHNNNTEIISLNISLF
ncbi:MAG TPA: DUF488 domain-containing protein [Nanoarchaeota archaeon]|nr:DUF488 domain-containing protein [Nanoarchaeota archaeon]